MIDRRIGKIKVRRGTDAQRKPIIFEEGELIYSIDKKRLYVGDDITTGGVLVSNRNYIVDTIGTPGSVPSFAEYGDIIHDKNTQNTYIIGYNLDQTLKLILIASVADDCTVLLLQRLEDLKTQLNDLKDSL